MDFRTLFLAPLLMFLTATTAPDCEGEPPVQHWPEGNYVGYSVYEFDFDDAPYILAMDFTSFGENGSGDVDGEYRWRFWLDQESRDSGGAPDCVFVDTLMGNPHAPGSAPYEYETCIGCDPYADFQTQYLESTGDNCTPELFTYWYEAPGSGLPDEGLSTTVGYRNAEEDGWPEELEALVPAMEELGFQGMLYDTILEGNGFDAIYAVGPLDSPSDERQERPHLLRHVSGAEAFNR